MEKNKPTRREFFRRSAILAGSAPAVLGLRAQSFGQADKIDIRCGMIGTGNRGKAELRAIKQVPGVRVAALCDINPKALQEALEIVGDHQPKSYSYHLDLLAQKDLDAVFVETPPYLHREHVIDVLNSGRHCSVAKPLALTVNEIEDIRRAARTAKGILHVDQQLRYRPQYLKAMKLIHDGEIGDVGFVRAQRYSNWDGKIAAGPTQRMKTWLYKIELSGDTIVENQIHNIDIINWVMNDHPIRASGFGGQNMIVWDGNELLDNYGLTFEYPGNRHAIFSKISYAVSEFGGTFIHAYGSKAAADVSYDGAVKIVWRGKDAPPPMLIDRENVDMNLASVHDFFQAIEEGRQPWCGVEVGSTAALTTLLGRKAIYEKRVVTWEELLREGAAPRPLRI